MVLIVEDDRDLRTGLNLRLRAAGYDTTFAEDGLGAVTTARRERPDVVLLDLGLPAGDGYTVLERFRNFPFLAVVPVIVLTGRDPKAAEERARALGAVDFLQKPADNDRLLEALASATGRRSA
jgi:CheY-like chemotaxis protein